MKEWHSEEEIKAQLRELTPTEAASLRLPSSGHAPLLDLEFARWMTDPRSADRPHGETIASGGVDGAALPIEITRQRWPPEYLDD